MGSGRQILNMLKRENTIDASSNLEGKPLITVLTNLKWIMDSSATNHMVVINLC